MKIRFWNYSLRAFEVISSHLGHFIQMLGSVAFETKTSLTNIVGNILDELFICYPK